MTYEPKHLAPSGPYPDDDERPCNALEDAWQGMAYRADAPQAEHLIAGAAGRGLRALEEIANLLGLSGYSVSPALKARVQRGPQR